VVKKVYKHTVLFATSPCFGLFVEELIDGLSYGMVIIKMGVLFLFFGLSYINSTQKYLVLTMHVLLIKISLQIPNAHSLKDKRRQMKSLKDRLGNRFNASIAEIDALDNWQQAVLGVCMISKDKSYLDKQYNKVETLVLEYTELELLSMTREWL
jgi:hypothetical protein